ncbi:MAG: hypothetical protein KDD10_04655 [Phaeodactylibacter sp.]|nr:hypothetical protein [Phaeodactylibacter sp.]MCB9295935.1 hypothetical protein [Lewinellaceae bacterium]
MQHLPAIKKALGISAVYTTAFSYLQKATEEEKGLQVDMLMERADQIIHLFEIKFHNTEFVLSKDYAERLQARIQAFQRLSKTRKQVFLTFITTFGLKPNKYSTSLVNQSLTLDDLFLE